MNKYPEIEELDETIRSGYPWIIAESWAWFYGRDRPLERLGGLLGLFETSVRYVALLAVSEYCRQGVRDAAIDGAVADLWKPSSGHWVRVLKTCAPRFRSVEGLFCPMLRQCDQSPRVGQQYLLDGLITVRNQIWAHGGMGPQIERESPSLLDKWTPPLTKWLADLSWISDYPLFQRLPDGSAASLMGLRPRFTESLSAKEDLYFAHGTETLRAFPLYLVHARQNQPDADLFLYQGALEDRVKYLSWDQNLTVKDPQLVEALTTLMPKLTEEASGQLDPLFLIEAARESTLESVKQAVAEGRFLPDLYFERADMERVFSAWLQQEKPGLLVAGEAGSGKSTALMARAREMALGPDPVVLLEGRRLVDCGLDVVTQAIARALGRNLPLPVLLESLAKRSAPLMLMVDAVDESADPLELLCSLVQILCGNPGRIRCVATIRDFALSRILDQLPTAIATGLEEHFEFFPVEIGGRTVRRFWFLLPRLAGEAFDRFFEHYRANFDIQTLRHELEDSTVELLANPHLLHIACELHRHGTIEARLSQSILLREYVERRLEVRGTGEPCPRSLELLERIVRCSLELRTPRVDMRALEDDSQTARLLEDRDPTAPFQRLQGSGLLTVLHERRQLIARRWVRVSFERLHEVLLDSILNEDSLSVIIGLVKQEPLYPPLVGALTMRMMRLDRDPNGFKEVAFHLDHNGIRQASVRAMSELPVWDEERTSRELAYWASQGEAGIEAVTDTLQTWMDKGRWDQADRFYHPARAGVPALAEGSAAVARLDLLHADTCWGRGRNHVALDIAERYLRHSVPEIRTQAQVMEVLVLDSADPLGRYLEASVNCLELAREREDADLKAFALWSLGCHREYVSDYLGALDYYEQILALEDAERAVGRTLSMRPYRDDLAMVPKWIARSLTQIPERTREAEHFFLDALRRDQEARDTYQLNVDWDNLSFYYRTMGDLENALRYSDLCFLQEGLFSDDPEWEPSCANRAAILLLLGRIAEAGEYARRALTIGERPDGVGNYLTESFLVAIATSMYLGDFLQASLLMEKLRAHMETDDLDDSGLVSDTAQLALDLRSGVAARGTVRALHERARAAHQEVNFQDWLGLAFFAAAKDCPWNEATRETAEVLFEIANNIGNTFWTKWAMKTIQYRASERLP